MSETPPDETPDPLAILQQQYDELNEQFQQLTDQYNAVNGANLVLWDNARGFAHHPPRGVGGVIGQDMNKAVAALNTWADTLWPEG